jgi:sugar O-acyltransferase (sialic acid O-acetyltransferase NeuD family)
MAKLVLFGTGDIARLAHVYFTRDSEHDVVAFTVDGAYVDQVEYRGLPLFPFEEIVDRYPPDDFQVFIAVSYAQMNRLRAERFEQARILGYHLPSYVSSRCSYLSDEPPGDNCFILEDNTIQPFVTIGHDVTLWSGNHIGHDSTIEDHTFISSHVVISGHVRVGAFCFLGVNSTVGHQVTIAPRTLLAAGAVVTKDTNPGGVYVPSRTMLVPKSSDDVEL